MGTIGDCYDTMIESSGAGSRPSCSTDKQSRTRIELANALFEYLEIFHNRRRHSALGMLTDRIRAPGHPGGARSITTTQHPDSGKLGAHHPARGRRVMLRHRLVPSARAAPGIGMPGTASTARLSPTGCTSGNGHLHDRAQQASARPLPGRNASVPSVEAGAFFLASGPALPSAPSGARIGDRHRSLIRTGVRQLVRPPLRYFAAVPASKSWAQNFELCL
jgi:hypothetical protein